MKNLSLILVFTVALFAFSGCKNTKSNEKKELSTDMVMNPNTASGQANTEDVPEVTFNEEEHDFGRVMQGEKVSFSFKFKNTGKAPLLISSVSSSCGCTVPEYPKDPVKPGEENYITVSFNSEGKRGFQNKSVTLVSNAQPGTKVLRIKAEVVLP